MAQLVKFCHRAFLFLIIVGCNSHLEKEPSKGERKELGRQLWDQENAKHGFNGRFQGTPMAFTLLNKILSLDPENCDALREVSVPYLKRGLPHVWKPLFDKAVACDPVTWQPWRGYLYLWFYRDYEKAIADFDASDVLTPDFIDSPQGHSVDYWRGIAYLGNGDYEKSISYFQKHLSHETKEFGEEWVEPQTFLYMGISYFEDGRPEDALTCIEKYISYCDDHTADGHYYKALISRELTQKKQALQSAEKAVEYYEKGYYNSRPYVEEMRQVYLPQIRQLRASILQDMNTTIK